MCSVRAFCWRGMAGAEPRGRPAARILPWAGAWTWWCALLLCALLAAAPARAESLASLKPLALPAWPAGPTPQHLVASQGRLLALTGSTLGTLDPTSHRWIVQPLSLTLRGMAAGVGPGQAAVLLVDAAGGAGAAGGQQVVQLLQRDGRWQAEALAPLPPGLRDAQLARHGDTLWLLARSGDGPWRLLQSSAVDASQPWRAVAPPPADGEPLALVAQASALLMVQRRGNDVPDHLWRYTTAGGWQDRGPVPGRLQGPLLRGTGQAHVLMALQPAAGAPARWATWQHITGSWATLPGVAVPAAATSATAWRDGLAWLAPEAPAAQALQVVSPPNLLSSLDWVVLVLYLGAMLGIGLYFYLRDKHGSTADFFVGGRSIPFWAAGISLYATNTSSISYIAIPAKAFESNWTYMTNNLVAVCALVFVGLWVVPLLRRLDLMSVFHYLEHRFHPAIRMLSSALCIVVQVGSRLSVVLYLPALAIATITGIDVVWSVLLMGGFTIAYTALGGMKAVIWTDCVQLVVMAGGALFAIGFMVGHIDGGWPAFDAAAQAADKTKLLDFSFDLTKATVWGFVFLVLFDVVLTFPKDQVLMQRVLSTPSDREAGRSIWAFAAIMVPGGFVFYGIGTALYVYYQAHPERMNPLLGVDATFPLFIAAELPAGLTGLIIAGIFAAAMSTLSSIINSVATLISVDFYERLARQPDARTSVRLAEWMSVLVGLVGMGLALLLSRFDIQSMFDVSIELAGLLGGGFAGAYTLGMFSRRANAPGVAIGVAAAIVLTTLAWSMKLVHPYFYLAISILVCIVVGWCASWLFPPPARSLAGLTIWRVDAVR